MQTDAAMPTPSAPDERPRKQAAGDGRGRHDACREQVHPVQHHRVRATPNTTGSVATPTAASASTSRTFGSSASTNDRKRKYATMTNGRPRRRPGERDWEEREGAVAHPPRRRPN